LPRKPRKKETKEAEAAKEAPKETPEEKPVAKDDFILVDLTGKAEETGEVFETTNEETARTAGLPVEGKTFAPRVVVAGDGWVLKGLDDGFIGLKVGGEGKVEVSPADAFGERDMSKIQTIPYRVLRSKGVNPTLGAQVDYEGRTAIIRSIGAGRVQLDFNPPLAGRKLLYDVKVLKRFETDDEKIRALIQRRILAFDTSKFGIKITKKKADITVPEEIIYGENIQFVKRGISLDILKYFPKLENVTFIEEFKREPAAEEKS